MKKLLAIIALSLYFITPSQADAIRDFQIEGMSIGDSALKFFPVELIKKSTEVNKMNKVNKKYQTFSIYSKSFGNYINVADYNFEVFDAIEITYKTNDEKFIIKGLAGSITNQEKKNIKNIKDCERQKNNIFKDVKQLFKKSISNSDNGTLPFDKSGKSKYFRSAIQLSPNSKYLEIEVNCHYFTGKITKYYVTNVGVAIKTDELNDWLTKQYK
jgi:hypothetical protein